MDWFLYSTDGQRQMKSYGREKALKEDQTEKKTWNDNTRLVIDMLLHSSDHHVSIQILVRFRVILFWSIWCSADWKSVGCSYIERF